MCEPPISSLVIWIEWERRVQPAYDSKGWLKKGQLNLDQTAIVAKASYFHGNTALIGGFNYANASQLSAARLGHVIACRIELKIWTCVVKMACDCGGWLAELQLYQNDYGRRCTWNQFEESNPMIPIMPIDLEYHESINTVFLWSTTMWRYGLYQLYWYQPLWRWSQLACLTKAQSAVNQCIWRIESECYLFLFQNYWI